MNKTTATHNAKDVYHEFAKLLLEDPDHWPKWDRKKKDKYGAIMRMLKNDRAIEVISIDRWMGIIKLYFLLARKKVVEGEALELGNRMGVIRARTVARNFKNKQINWAETNKQPIVIDPVTGKKKRERIIYHTSETYSRISWEKSRLIPNERLYKFIPSQGSNSRGGFKQEFKKALKEDPLLETRYKQFTHELFVD